MELFDESGFDIYTCQALMEVEDDEEEPLARDVEVKLVTNEALENIWTCFYEVVELFDSLDMDACVNRPKKQGITLRETDKK